MEDIRKYHCGYAIASKSNVCGGHGCYFDELQITPEKGYGRGEFPPIFPTEEEAKDYIKEKKLYKDVVNIRIVL